MRCDPRKLRASAKALFAASQSSSFSVPGRRLSGHMALPRSHHRAKPPTATALEYVRTFAQSVRVSDCSEAGYGMRPTLRLRFCGLTFLPSLFVSVTVDNSKKAKPLNRYVLARIRMNQRFSGGH